MHPVRLVVMAGAVVTTIVGTTGLTDHPPLGGPRVAAAWVLTLAFIAALALGQGRPTAAPDIGALAVPRQWRTDTLVTITGSVTALLFVVPTDTPQWLVYVVVVIAATSRDIPLAVALSMPPVVAHEYAVWEATRSVPGVGLSLVGLIAAFGVVRFRRAQREARELADARQKVIAEEHARLAAAEQQRAVSAQLHDVLAHTLSGLIVSLQTAGLQARAEGASPQLQERITSATGLAKDGLDGARQAVSSLRRAAGFADAREAADLDAWWQDTVARMRDATGLEVTTVGDAAAVPAAWGPLAEAVLREALTNSLRHAAGRPVRVSFLDGTVRVLSQGDVTTFTPSEHTSGGFGLAGLRERVEAAGASFDAGATEDGWLVTMTWTGSAGRAE